MNEDEDGYTGPAVLTVDGESIDIVVQLYGRFQPLDGRYHWYGRLAGDAAVSHRIGSQARTIALSIGESTVSAQVGDPDLWGRYRIEGMGLPPFRIALELTDVEAIDDNDQRF
jgi:hypothetical protein